MEIVKTMTKEESRKWYMVFHKKRTWILILIPISLLILWIVRSNTQIAEYVFARGVYKWLSQGLSLLTGILPFSAMEVEILVLPILAIAIIIHFFWRISHRKDKKQSDLAYLLMEGFLNTACTLSVILFLFVNLAGVNYYRYPFASYSGLEIQKSTVEELYNLSLDLAKDAAEIRAQLQIQDVEVDKNGVLQQNNTSWRELSNTAQKSFKKLSKDYPVLGGFYGSPKPVFFSRLMSKMEITGIFFPFTMEANVNVDATSYSVPATMSHELAHLRGFMREDEANFIAYLACKQSDS